MRDITRRSRSASCAALCLAFLVAPADCFAPSALRHSDRIIIGSTFLDPAFYDSIIATRWSPSANGPRQSTRIKSSSSSDSIISLSPFQTTEELNDAISDALSSNSDRFDALKDAMELLNTAENATQNEHNNIPRPDHTSYSLILSDMASFPEEDFTRHAPDLIDQVEYLFQRMKRVSKKHPECAPLRVAYNAVLLAWSKTYRREASRRCDQLLTELWSLYNNTTNNIASDDDNNNDDIGLNNPYCPSHSTYISVLRALARSRGGRYAAERGEQLLEDMERLSSNRPVAFSHLRPTVTCVNIVL